jgi:hypothetical protein
MLDVLKKYHAPLLFAGLSAFSVYVTKLYWELAGYPCPVLASMALVSGFGAITVYLDIKKQSSFSEKLESISRRRNGNRNMLDFDVNGLVHTGMDYSMLYI